MNMADCGLFTRMIRTRPLLLAALLCLIGCICGYALNLSASLYCACIAAFLLLALLFSGLHKRRAAAAILLLVFLPMGALRFDLSWNSTAPLAEQKNAVLRGRICRTPDWNAETERTLCVLEDFSIDGTAYTGRLRLYLRGDTTLLQSVQLGQELCCEAHIWEAEASANPGEFDFSNYLRISGLRAYATAQIESAELTEPTFKFQDWPERASAYLAQRIFRLFPENAAIAQAFLLGDRSGLSAEERESYSVSGAAHLLAISGMHVSMLAGALSLLLARFSSKRTAFYITLAALLAYGALIGFSASIFRAILMYAVFNAAPLAGRYSDAPTRLGAAMLIYLLIRPMAILESSFVLSYGACAGIILLYAPLTRLFYADEYLRKTVSPGGFARIRQSLLRWMVQSLLITLAAQLAILPAVVHYFGSQPIWSFAVNLIAVPLAMAAYLLAIIGTITGFAPVALLSDRLFGLLSDCVYFFSHLPLRSIGIARFPLWLLLLCAVACFCASDLCRLPEKLRRALPFTVLLAVLISNACACFSSRGCSVVFLSAGEADCAVIRSQHKIYLVDTGDAYSPAADYLSAMNYKLEGIFLSHPHMDHAGGLDEVLDVCLPRQIYLSANWAYYEMDEAITSALERAQALGVEIVSLSCGDCVQLSDETSLEVLSPEEGFPAKAANDDSLILRLRYGACSAVFTGDASAETASGCIGDVDLLKVAHHGSNDALSASLLSELSPSVAILSVGYNNYGHPTEQSLKLLNSANTAVFRTDHHGAISCRLHMDGSIDVHTYQISEAIDGLE